MGLMDTINPEDRIEMKFNDFYKLVKNSTSAELMLNGIKNRVDHDAMHKMITGKPLPEAEVKEESEE